MLDKPGTHKCIVRVFWECLAEALCPQDFEVPPPVLHFVPREAEDTESQWTMSIHQVAGACHNDNPYTRLWQPEVKVTIKLKEVLWGTVGCTSAKGITLLSLQRKVYARVPKRRVCSLVNQSGTMWRLTHGLGQRLQ